jgi:hypothetical protein
MLCYTLSTRPRSNMKRSSVSLRLPQILQSSSPRPTPTGTSAPSSPLPNHQTQSYLRALPTSDDVWTVATSPLPPRLPHIPVHHLHAHPHRHGHYYHHSYGAAPRSLGHTGGERRLRVSVRQIRDAPMANLPSVSASGSGASPTSTSTLPSSR